MAGSNRVSSSEYGEYFILDNGIEGREGVQILGTGVAIILSPISVDAFKRANSQVLRFGKRISLRDFILKTRRTS
jgi:hypothetical protein